MEVVTPRQLTILILMVAQLAFSQFRAAASRCCNANNEYDALVVQ